MALGLTSNRDGLTTRQTGAPATGPASDASGPTGTVPLSNVSGADDVKALEALDGTAGILVKTAANAYARRSLAVALPLAISNAAGTAGNPTITLDAVASPASADTNDTKIRVTIGGQAYDILAVVV